MVGDHLSAEMLSLALGDILLYADVNTKWGLRLALLAPVRWPV